MRIPLLRRIGLGLAAACLPCAAPPSTAMASPPSWTSRPSVVGFWAGEDVVTAHGRQPSGPDNYYEPAYRGALTPAVWEVLREQHVPLYINMRYGRDFGPVPAGTRSDATALVRKANALGVPVIAWLVVPFKDGYWAYEGNAATMKTAARAWSSWKNAKRLRFSSVALDQEFSWRNLQTYISLRLGGDTTGLTNWMSGNIDPDGQCAAFRTYRDLISWAHDRGIAVTAAQAPMIADDLRDGKTALQDALNMTGSSPGYDQTYLMAYRSAVAQAASDPGPAYVASYYADMRTYFGRTGQVSLGIGGEAPYDTLTPMVNDVRMLTGLGAKQIPVYSLETTVDEFGAAGVQKIVEAARHPMKGTELAAATRPTPFSEALRAASAQMDATATTLTQQVHPRGPNTWPGGCGDLTVRPLAHRPPARGH
ncbi:hypothetical protein [Actinomadura nitritigenes]|uniref:hypothetical protein n=1 Tax=Actinomadura nitritigenes TaxID=134602 RepID=UPI003D8FD431